MANQFRHWARGAFEKPGGPNYTAAVLRGALKRLEAMLGEWSGQLTRPEEAPSLLFFEARDLYDGTVLEIESRGYTPEGHYLFGSVGMLAEGPDGGLAYSLYSTSLGAIVMHEQPDEPSTLLLNCPLDAERVFHVTMALDGDLLALSSSVSRDGRLPPRSARILCELRRLNTSRRKLLSRKAGVE